MISVWDCVEQELAAVVRLSGVSDIESGLRFVGPGSGQARLCLGYREEGRVERKAFTQAIRIVCKEMPEPDVEPEPEPEPEPEREPEPQPVG